MPALMHAASAVALTAFLASFVECVEASTIVLAVGVTRGIRVTTIGTLGGLLTLALLVAAARPLLAYIPLGPLRLVVGILVLFFGMRWLRKAILRYAGAIAFHDETEIYTRETSLFTDKTAASLDRAGIVAAYGAVVLEGVEVAFVVVAIGVPSGMLAAAATGAVAAALIVVALALALRQPLARIPENALKFTVGVMLSAIGTLWAGEGLGMAWPGNDAALMMLVAAFAATGAAAVPLVRRIGAEPTRT